MLNYSMKTGCALERQRIQNEWEGIKQSMDLQLDEMDSLVKSNYKVAIGSPKTR